MGHSHTAGWRPQESYAFAEAFVKTGRCWIRETGHQQTGNQVSATFQSDRPIEKAELFYTSGSGYTGNRDWKTVPAVLMEEKGTVTVSAELPAGSTAWYFNIHAGPLTASSDFVEAKPVAEKQ